MGKHKKFAASAAGRWLSCTASVTIDAPERRTRYSDEGNRLHEMAHRCLEGGHATAGRVAASPALTAEEVESVDAYLAYLRELPNSQLWELRVGGDHPDVGGTLDCAAMQPGHLEVVDYKAGKGVEVEAVNNAQLMVYAIGVDLALESVWSFDRFTATVVQPAFGPPKSWHFDRRTLETWRRKILGTVDKVERGDVEFAPSEENCRFCDARPVCPAMQKIARRAALDDFAEFIHKPPAISAAAVDVPRGEWSLEQRMDAVPVLEAWCRAVKDEVKSRALSGEVFERWKIVEGKRTRRWEDPERAARLISRAAKVPKAKLYVPPTPLSPAQAEAALAEAGLEKPRREALVGKHVAWSPGSPTLAPASDRRPSIQRKTAREDFAPLLGDGKPPGEEEEAEQRGEK